jgi:crotonobetainyl-CoA:carnitine CoA-transferase CaiB-like acyl-CoA transferase
VELPHPLHGTFTVEGSRVRLSRTPAQVVRCGPTLGRDSDHVLREILGYDDARIRALVEAGALR